MAKELQTGQVKEKDYSIYGNCLSKKELCNIITKYYNGFIPKTVRFKYRFSKRFLIERVDYSDYYVRLSAVNYIGMGFVRVYVDKYYDDIEDYIHNEYIFRY